MKNLCQLFILFLIFANCTKVNEEEVVNSEEQQIYDMLEVYFEVAESNPEAVMTVKRMDGKLVSIIEDKSKTEAMVSPKQEEE